MGFTRTASPTSSLSHTTDILDNTIKHRTNGSNSNSNSNNISNSSSNNDIEQQKQHQQQQNQHQLQVLYDDSPRSHLKLKLKSLLAKYNGCTKNNEVREVVHQLSELNPSSQNCAQLDLFQGEFCTLTAPHFPGRIVPPKHPLDDDDAEFNNDGNAIIQYTLGKLSFKIFQPNNLVCTLRSIRNPVMPTNKMTPDGKQEIFTYHLVLDITIHTPDGYHDLPATMINEAHCHQCPDVNNRLIVSFKGGTLLPTSDVVNDTSLLKIWCKTFENAYQKADQERSYVGWFLYYIMKFFLGLTLPSDYNKNKNVMENSFHFDMKRSPMGHFDVLYLDEEIRITRGNKGTIVVVERTTTAQ